MKPGYRRAKDQTQHRAHAELAGRFGWREERLVGVLQGGNSGAHTRSSVHLLQRVTNTIILRFAVLGTQTLPQTAKPGMTKSLLASYE